MNTYLKNHPFWCICSLFCFGVFTSPLAEQFIVPIAITGLFIGVVLYCLQKSISNSLFICLSSLLFFIIGNIRYQISQPKYQSKHIINKNNSKTPKRIILSIVDIYKCSKKATNYKVKIHSIDHQKCKGYALLSVPKKASDITYQLGDSFTAFTKLKLLKTLGNPYAFEYVNYLKTQDITHKIWITHKRLHPIKPLINKFSKFSYKLRNHIESELRKQHLLPRVLQITETLVLGNKSILDPELKVDFANAGVIHILAISGLHIGILYLLLNGVFNLVFPYSKNNIFIAISIILFLWLFSWFSGSSPSALRATTMFTCFQFSKILSRPQHPINALFLSCFILVFIDPTIVFSVGFQLSITAVAAIIIGVPKLLAFWYPKNWLARKIWNIVCLSICAQLGILPLSIYYFHQFSSLFLLANIPIMFIISIVLTCAILIVIFSSFFNIPSLLISIYNEIISIIINYIGWIAHFEQFIFKEQYINTYTLLFCYIFIFYLAYMYISPRKAYKCSLLIFSTTIIVGFWEYQQRIFKNELWLLNTYNNIVITELTSDEMKIHSTNQLNNKVIEYLIKPISGNLHYSKMDTLTLQNSYQYGTNNIHIMNTKDQLPNKFVNTILILNNSPQINMERFLKNYDPKLIIATAKNYSNLIEKWKATCSNEQVAFYTVAEKGAINITSLLNTLKK